MRILILGGTIEARRLSESFKLRPDTSVIVSLAGRTARPAALSVPVRIGGFGGARGLADYIEANRIDVLIDATHPYAVMISANAAEAVRQTGVDFLALRRPPWTKQAGDRWTEVSNVEAAADVLNGMPARRILLALGRKELVPFQIAPQHAYLIRTVDPVDPPLTLPDVAYLVSRGPFAGEDERRVLIERKIELIVCKNSGGTATYGKIAVARELGVEILLLRRPALAAVAAVDTVEAALAWLDHREMLPADRGV